ncbi:UDP-N-acetyl-D-mannosaminuronic acid dehydrogenase [Methanomicrobium sp. W14]|uniref:nucleotide sugar dehydrogenase n=1 Tax=Methanomicrobium sp. W14 TaxID=2817839 RepID=UPI001AE3C305|nr:nucleotide sugar dehydrogenase [Methanomicrobium sp. W14]MBP2133096.1 UDP-N-acetyl-D-mannosaminuronic acid dehydrogenase [Methanomicrobium sp. W14]
MQTTGSINDMVQNNGPIRTVGVIGMGYVGVPSAVLFADSLQFEKVYGFQRNSESSGYKIKMLNSGVCPLKGEEPGLENLLKKVVAEKKFECTPDFSKISECDAVTLAIQTPFKNSRDLVPDFTPLTEGLKNTGKYLKPEMLVVLESTITPGTTEGMAKEILEEESGLTAGEDFFLAHAPERVMVGRLVKNIREHDRVIGGIKSFYRDNSGKKVILDGINSPSTKRAMELYGPVLTKGKIIPMSATAAEVTKTTENTFRDLQIAAANQLSLYCEAMGINFYDVKKGVDSLKGEGITRAMLWPGAGVGGHCLTKDTYHLERGVKMLGSDYLDFPDGHESLYVLSREINDFMPKHMLHLTKSALKQAGKSLKGSRIALLGWAFLANSDDARNTPSGLFYEDAIAAGAEVRVHDPWIDPKNTPQIPHGLDKDLSKALKGADAVVVFTGHKDYCELIPSGVKKICGSQHPAIIDGRNVLLPQQWIKEGFIYKGIGRGDIL